LDFSWILVGNATRKEPFASSEKDIFIHFIRPNTMKTIQSYKTPAMLFALTLLALFVMPSCGKLDPVVKEPKKIELNKKSAEILQADRQFAFELFKEVNALSEEDNLMISSLSASYALGMTYNGAAGDTREAFRQVLHFDDLTDQEVNESYQDLMSQLVTLDDQVQFTIANSIWYKLGYEVLADFISTNRSISMRRWRSWIFRIREPRTSSMDGSRRRPTIRSKTCSITSLQCGDVPGQCHLLQCHLEVPV
jgi:hypothetical protein